MVRALTHVPVSIDWERGQVELLDLGPTRLAEPFFRDTVERVRRERAGGAPILVDLASFVLRAERYPAPPDALVFHVGRCGSTLLTNMLVAVGDCIAVKEPEVLNELVAAWLGARDERRRQVELVTGATVRILLGAIDSARPRILKLSAWNVQMAASLVAMFPTTPAAFVFRSPHETVASYLHEPPAWFDIIDAPRRAQARIFPSIAEVPDAQPVSATMLFAHAWRSAVEAAGTVSAGRLVNVGYDALVADPAAELKRLLDAWGRPLIGDGATRLAGILSAYSKDPAGTERFDPLGVHRRPALSPAQRREVDAVTGDLWRALDAAR